MPEDLQEQSFFLEDGRKLQFTEAGQLTTGFPVVVCHGTPGSRFFHYPSNLRSSASMARVITPDRPGYGRSDPLENLTPIGCAEDVAGLCEALDISELALIGFSGGAPYALATAWALPNLVSHVAIASGATPQGVPMGFINRLTYLSARHVPGLVRLFLRLTSAAVLKGPEAAVDRQIANWASKDRDIMLEPAMKSMYERNLIEAYRQGPAGHYRDLNALARPWGFPLNEISAPVTIWHGELDPLVPANLAVPFFCNQMPDAEATIFPGEGHFVLLNHWNHILERVAGG